MTENKVVWQTDIVNENYQTFGNHFTTSEYKLADKIYAWAIKNYGKGGYAIVDSLKFDEVIKFSSLKQAKEFASAEFDDLAKDVKYIYELFFCRR